MPAPDEALLKSLAGHHPLGETLGCMAGLFQMFEVHPTCIGRRYSSTRTGPTEMRAETGGHCNTNFAAEPRHRSNLDQREKSKHHRKTIPAVSRVVNMGASESSSDTRNHTVGGSFQKEVECRSGTTNTNNAHHTLSSRSHQSYFKSSQRPQDRRVDGSRKAAESSRSSSFSARSKPKEIVHQKEGLRSSVSLFSISVTKDADLLNDSDDSAKSPCRSAGRIDSRRSFTDGRGDSTMRSLRGKSLSRRDSEQSLSSRESVLVSIPSQKCDHNHLPSGEADSKGHRRVPSVIARLMGLEEIPISNQPSTIFASKVPDAPSRRDKLFKGLMQFDPQVQRAASPPPPTPCQSKKYVVHGLKPHSAFCRQQACDEYNYLAQYITEESLSRCEEDKDYEHASTKPFTPLEEERHEGFACPVFEQLEENDGGSSLELEHSIIQDVDTNVFTDMFMEPSLHKRKMLQNAFETIRPRVLLTISRRKQSDGGKPSPDKMITGDGHVAMKLDMNHEHQTQVDCAIKASESSTPAKNLDSSLYPISGSQAQEQQTESGDIAVLNVRKPARSQFSNADIFRVRHVETASGASNYKETCSIKSPVIYRRQATKPMTFKAVVDKAPRNAHSGNTLQYCWEYNPSSVRQFEKPGNVHGESKKTRDTTTKRNLSSRTPSLDTLRNQKSCSLHEGCSLFTRDSPNRVYSGGRVVSRKPFAKDERGGRSFSHEAFYSSLKQEPAHCNSEKTVTMESKSKKTNAIEVRPRNNADVSFSTTTDAAKIDTSDRSDPAPPRSAPRQLQIPDTEPVWVKSPKLRRLKELIVYVRRSPPPVQNFVGSSRVEPYRDTTEPLKSGACNADLLDPQLILQVQEAASKVCKELTTPRDVALKDEDLDDKQAGGLDRPRTISEAHHETPASMKEAYLDSGELFSKCSAVLPAQSQNTAIENRLDRIRAIFQDAGPGEEMGFVGSFLGSPRGAPDCRSHNEKCSSADYARKQSTSELTGTKNGDGNLLQRLQSNSTLQEHDPNLLLDSLEEILERVLGLQSNLILKAELYNDTVQAKLKTMKLEQEIWRELHDIQRTLPSEDTCKTVHRLVHKDLHNWQGLHWWSYSIEEGNISKDVEGMIVGDLIEETIRDLCTL
uniref:DUF4378 domain-containing protein n=3 Tax=Physcomitrium patens TaxID=3218 RepID=A0A7I4AWD5_PHYPA|nr:uncharacterized protein LOC112291315 isoform X2 [Physcomitrium patens]|eukprot:XP_024394287.1 uncharacterized protein LOC112291315 isoform X2 [Physcomitrella patens]